MNSENNYTGKNIEREISPKELILKIIDWLKFLIRSWKYISFVAIIFGIAGLLYALQQKPQYSAELTFVLEDSKSNPLNAYAGMASQFGIDLGGAGSSGLLAGDNIMEYLKSRLLVEKTLLSAIQVNNRQVTLADIFMEMYDYKSKWEKGPLSTVSFPQGQSRQSFSLLQDSILSAFHKNIVKKNLRIDKPDRKASFIAVVCTSPNETFSQKFTERLVKEATEFYMQTKTKRSKTNIEKLQQTVDSIENLLNKKTFSAALSMDLNRNPAKSVAMVGTELNARDKEILRILYAEVTKNLELAKMTMAQEMPLIQIVDTPILPLKKTKFGKLKGIVIGTFLGALLCVLILIVSRLYKKIMQ
ncbi:Wzz/FepE/Etk N-terminal domain-containing protein [Chitinophaga sp.]|uniref:Wzz/FepE/Etk N-terminal domain-containing protein n=1 Tax=Chitinophaga sp. TaxID=1869181 RepID=UPI0031D5B867